MIQTRGCRTNLVSATAPFVYSLKHELYTVTATTTGVAATTATTTGVAATAAGMATTAAAGRYRTVGARLVDKLCAWVIDLHLCIQSGHHLSAVCLVGT